MHTTSSFVHHFKTMGENKLELQSRNSQFWSKSAILCPAWPRNLMEMGKPRICFHCYCTVYDDRKYSDAFWLADRTRIFVQYTISLSSLCKLIWRHWTYKMPQIYFVECVSNITHILIVIHYTICGAVCFQFTHFPCDDWDNIYSLSYYHHEIGSMNYYPLFRVRSWNNGVRCMSFYILMGDLEKQ